MENHSYNISITTITEEDIDTVLPYVIEFRKQLFPMLDANKLPKDLVDFKRVYLDNQMGTFLQARDCMGQLVGVIGMLGYDYRFPHLGLDERKTVEVARLFVDPAYRRTGLGTVLFEYLLRIAKREEIERLYLHTHPFLEGACEFWLKQGFRISDVREECGFPTIHMEVLVGELSGTQCEKKLELMK